MERKIHRNVAKAQRKDRANSIWIESPDFPIVKTEKSPEKPRFYRKTVHREPVIFFPQSENGLESGSILGEKPENTIWEKKFKLSIQTESALHTLTPAPSHMCTTYLPFGHAHNTGMQHAGLPYIQDFQGGLCDERLVRY